MFKGEFSSLNSGGVREEAVGNKENRQLEL